MVKRSLLPILNAASKSILLLGPRQSGKTTLLKQLKPDCIVNLADEAEFIRISSDPDFFASVVKGHLRVLVDEVQRIPSLLNTIQSLLDDKEKNGRMQFFLSGSSARKLRRGQANLLPGRIFLYSLAGLSLRELKYEFDVKKALAVGFLPEPYLEPNLQVAEKILETYSYVYIKEEIQAEALTRNLQSFVRFLNVMAESAGDILDFSKISSKAKVSRSSIIRFVEILEDTLLGSRVEVFSEAEAADTIKHPKFYFFDPGVLNGLLGNFNASKDRMGCLFEHAVFAQLKNSAMAIDKKIEILYFRTRHDVEVDFIVRLNQSIYAIEVKSGEIHKCDLSSLKSFREYYPAVKKCFAVSPKETKRTQDNIMICSLPELLQELKL